MRSADKVYIIFFHGITFTATRAKALSPKYYIKYYNIWK